MHLLYVYLSKILPLMVLPIGLVIEISLLALLFLLLGRRRLSAGFLVLAMLVLWISSMPIVADTLLGRLEREYPPVPIENLPISSCIVVLGGAVESQLYPRVEINMLEAVDRVRTAARLFHAKKAELIIVSGGNQPWLSAAQPEAEAIKTLLMEWAVPASAIMLEAASRNTRENALNSSLLMKNLNCEKPLLVTSAAHMKRSVAAFEKLGISVFPVSTDVRVIKKSQLTLLDFLPDAHALKMTTDALKEGLGQLVYEMRDWN